MDLSAFLHFWLEFSSDFVLERQSRLSQVVAKLFPSDELSKCRCADEQFNDGSVSCDAYIGLQLSTSRNLAVPTKCWGRMCIVLSFVVLHVCKIQWSHPCCQKLASFSWHCGPITATLFKVVAYNKRVRIDVCCQGVHSSWAVHSIAMVLKACVGTCLLEAEVSPAGAGDWLQTNWTLAGQTFDPSLSACTFFPAIFFLSNQYSGWPAPCQDSQECRAVRQY